MRIFENTKIDFMRVRKLAAGFSMILVIAAIVALATRGLNFGIDFTGGTVIELGYTKPVELSPIRSALEKSGYDEAVVQHFGTAKDVLLRIAPRKGVTSSELSDKVFGLLHAENPDVELRRVEYVGPQVGDELAQDGGLAVLYALIGILIYVALRFEYRFALGSVIALIHDVTITLGLFAAFQWQFDLTVLAAVLAVIGYSLNDTIVVFDRIRENFRKIRKGSVDEVVNISLNQTLSRTTMTSFTTLLVVVALFLVGGELIHGFATALIIGIVVGTYSSIYVASAAAVALGVSRADLMPVKKEGEDLDDTP